MGPVAISGNCFVIMPFRPNLHYMYLYLKQHLERNHNLNCERGDSRYDQDGVLDKIRKYIQNADVIIADCSGRNPNVFYELGMAHVLDKPVILITSDDIEKAPTDVKSFEFIRYNLTDDTGFLKNLDGALTNVMGSFDALYEAARALFAQFREDTHLQLEEAKKEEFAREAATRARTGRLPTPDDKRNMAKYLMPAISAGNWDIDILEAAKAWIDEKYPAPD